MSQIYLRLFSFYILLLWYLIYNYYVLGSKWSMNTVILSVILILGFIVIYWLLVQVFSVLFRLSGLTKEKSVFQVVSLLTSVGFTTAESEIITSDKRRRRIAMFAMITSYTFSVIIVSLVVNMLLNLSNAQAASSLWIVAIIFVAFIFLMIFINLPFIRRTFDSAIEKLAIKFMKKNKGNNTITLLDNYGKEAICEILLTYIPDQLYGKSLFESKIKDLYSINVLMIKRKGKMIEVRKDTMVQKGDILVVFGISQNIKDFFHSKKDVTEALELSKKPTENTLDLIDNFGKDAMAEVTINKIPEILEGKTLFTSGLKSEYGINILLLKRDDMPVYVTKDTILQERDVITVFGTYQNIKNVFIYSNKEKKNER